ncbi:Coenzyme F420 hydrogenase/dehydrogenase, beta subunit C-terminal domain [Lachnospiraceae bacterium ZAX-1]
MRDVVIAITAASYSGNQGAAAMLQSSIQQLYQNYGHRLNIKLMSVYPSEDKEQLPYDFIEVVSCKPEQLLFIAFPLAILYKAFSWCPPIKKLIAKNKIIRAYRETDAVVDEAGISFVDSRGFVMNVYAFVCAAVPMLVGVPVVKYSQAMGTFQSFVNRFLAKWILPKCKLICARGEGTLNNLVKIGIVKNVKLCADGAFTMADNPDWNDAVDKVCADDSFYNDNVIALSISSVVQKKCTKLNINYKDVMVSFIDDLNKQGYHVLILANAARIHSTKSRNNDLLICSAVHLEIADKTKVRWYCKEMTPEEIRAYISHCRVLVASRFHAMIGALEKKVPVLLIGWSHKYQEVLDMFGLGQYAIDFSNLNLDALKKEFDHFLTHEVEIKNCMETHYETVMESSKDNIRYISEVIEETLKQPKKGRNTLFDYNNPDKYIGNHVACRKGYATDASVRENAASGGMVTALLCHWLDTKQIDGAWVTKSHIEEGDLSYQTFVATTKEELCSASSSIYMQMPLLKHLDVIRKFEGKVAVVLTPCLMNGFTQILEKDQQLKEKIVIKLALYCSGNHSKKATLLSLKKAGITLDNAQRMYYRRGHWRGTSTVQYKDGTEKNFSYTKTICAYKNAFFFEQGSCMQCQDQYGRHADLSFGDIWLKEMKKEQVKHTSCVIRNQKAYDMYQSAVDARVITDKHLSDTKMIKSQKRALAFKYSLAKAKMQYYRKKTGKDCAIDILDKCKWNHRLAFYLARKNKEFSEKKQAKLEKIPTCVIYYYMCFIRVLLSF